MGKAIFQTEIIELGEQVDAFFEEGMFVLFGDNVPDTLKDFCHFIDQKKVDGTIKKGDKLVVDQKEYLITAVGDIAQSNLETLGHLTVVFSGAKEAGLPGSICVEAKPMPKLAIRSKISICSLVYKSLLPSLRITDTSNRTKNMGQAASLIPFLLNKAQTMPASILHPVFHNDGFFVFHSFRQCRDICKFFKSILILFCHQSTANSFVVFRQST